MLLVTSFPSSFQANTQTELMLGDYTVYSKNSELYLQPVVSLSLQNSGYTTRHNQFQICSNQNYEFIVQLHTVAGNRYINFSIVRVSSTE